VTSNEVLFHLILDIDIACDVLMLEGDWTRKVTSGQGYCPAAIREHGRQAQITRSCIAQRYAVINPVASAIGRDWISRSLRDWVLIEGMRNVKESRIRLLAQNGNLGNGSFGEH